MNNSRFFKIEIIYINKNILQIICIKKTNESYFKCINNFNRHKLTEEVRQLSKEINADLKLLNSQNSSDFEESSKVCII